MIFKQFRYEPLAQASYIVGCIRTKKAFVVDPIDDLGVDFYVLEAADRGLNITGVLETHVHADYLSCAGELSRKTGSPHFLHEAIKGITRYDFTPLSDGQVLELGKVRVEVIHTPGHTPEHACYVVYDAARSEEPWAVLTGDCLFVGDVGRPDLLLEDEALNVMGESERAENLYRSINERLFTLPDHVEVWPAHYGGSTCGGVNMSGKASSTIYFEKRFNLALAQNDGPAFARFIKETAKPFPDNYARIKSYNLGLTSKEEVGAETPIESAPTAASAAQGLGVDEFLSAVAEGAIPIDMHSPFAFADEHVPGSINLQFNRADLADRAEMVLPEGLSIVLVAESDAVAAVADGILLDAGFEVKGYLSGGLQAFKRAGHSVASMPVMRVEELYENTGTFEVVDAREPFEFKFGHIPGATVLPSMRAWRGASEIKSTKPLAVVCGDQVRSALVASILMRTGNDARLVSGGMTDWLERGYPIEKGD